MSESADTDVVVIGAGWAGLSAAVRLADAGKRVVVLEGAPKLGGRASTFTDPATGERVDNGQHVLFGCYRDTYAFLKKIGTEGLAPLDRTLSLRMVGSDGQPHQLSCPALPAPWHLVAGVLRWTAVPWRDRIRVFNLVGPIRRHRSISSTLTVTEWLTAHGQSAELRRWLWTPLAFAALNQSPDVAAADPFIRVLQELFGPRAEDSAVGLPAVPLDELYATAAQRFIEQHGGRVFTRSAARVAMRADGRVAAIAGDGGSIGSHAVVSAVPWHAFEKLWQGPCPPEIGAVRAAAARMQSSPIVTVNVWLDRFVSNQRFVGLPDGRMHWAFNKAAIFGQHSGHVSLVSSGARDLADMDNAQVAEIARQDLLRAFPEAKDARVMRSQVVREHRATFSLAPGEPPRPPTTTSIPGFVLAGDWTDTGLPATIEGAVRSGRAAADEVLRARGEITHGAGLQH